MIKQILGKLPRKHSKLSYDFLNGEGKVNAPSSYLDPNSENSSKTSSGFSKSSNLANGSLAPNASHTGPVSDPDMYDALPSFKDVPSSEKSNLFIRKLNVCCIVFDFTDPSKSLKEKEIKRQNLLELVDYISSVSTKFNDMEMQEVTNMVAANIFRTFPSANHYNKISEMYDLEVDESAFEPSWPHLQPVYEVLLRFVVSPQTDARLAKKHINQAFVISLLDLFDSEDQRERDYLKTVLHRIYGKFMMQRPFIRKAINNIFYRFTYETEKHSGIAELLEILGSIINGFALPLKEEHKLFLVRTLIPLHKPKCAAAYGQQLSYCIVQFVEKDSKLADTIIRGLLKCWPITNSSKEVMFLGELEEVLDATQAAEFQQCVVPLFRQIGRCLNSLHFQVAERALLLWNNDHIRNLILQNRKVVLPIIFPALERNTTGHWNQAVRNLTLNVEKFFSHADQKLLDECLVKHREDKANQNEPQTKGESTWKRLDDLAASRSHRSVEAVFVPRFIPSIPLQILPSPAEELVGKEEKLMVK